jgi:hypothetical protein
MLNRLVISLFIIGFFDSAKADILSLYHEEITYCLSQPNSALKEEKKDSYVAAMTRADSRMKEIAKSMMGQAGEVLKKSHSHENCQPEPSEAKQFSQGKLTNLSELSQGTNTSAKEVSLITDDQFLKLSELFYELDHFAWGYTEDGCSYRAHEIARILKGLGLSPVKVSLEGPISYQAHEQDNPWLYHIATAIAVETPKGVVYKVFDPAVFKSQNRGDGDLDSWYSKLRGSEPTEEFKLEIVPPERVDTKSSTKRGFSPEENIFNAHRMACFDRALSMRKELFGY